MALSNWDTLAIDLDGKPCDTFVSSDGIEVSFYKNWLYVRDAKAWREGSYVEPTIMQIQDGTIQYRGVEIVAVRGPQNGVYAAISETRYGKTKMPMRGIVGCGVSGYVFNELIKDHEYLGVTQECVDFLKQFLLKKETGVSYTSGIDADGESSETQVSEFSYDLFDDEIRNAVKFLDNTERFNQGDAFFAAALQLDELEATKVGEAEDPLMIKALKTGDGQ